MRTDNSRHLAATAHHRATAKRASAALRRLATAGTLEIENQHLRRALAEALGESNRRHATSRVRLAGTNVAASAPPPSPVATTLRRGSAESRR